MFTKIVKSLGNELEYVKGTYKSILSRVYTSFQYELVLKQLKKEISKPSNMEIENLSFPIVIDKPFQKFLLKFMNSPRNIDHPTININNLLFLTGPERSGKTWFLRQTLETFQKGETKLKNLVVHFDCRTAGNFSVFLHLFEKELVETLHRRIIYLTDVEDKNFKFDLNTLLSLLFFRYEKSWIEHHLFQELKSIKNGDSILDVDSNLVEDLIIKFMSKGFKETPILDNIEQLVKDISKRKKISELLAAMLLIKNVLIWRENFDSGQFKEYHYEIMDIRDLKLKYNKFHHEQYRTGLNVLEYFLDIINYISGYHDIQIIESSIGFKIKNERNIEPSNHIQSILALEHVEELFNYCDAEQRAVDWIQHLILRLYNDKGYRDHFPVVIESNMNYYFESEMYKDLWDNRWRFPTLYYKPMQYLSNLPQYLDNFANNIQKQAIESLLKDSPIYYYCLIADIIRIEGVEGFEMLLSGKHCIFEKDYAMFRYKVNKLFVNPRLEKYLDSGEIDWLITNAIGQWGKFAEDYPNETFLTIRKRIRDHEYFRQSITKAMLDENIILFEQYFKKVIPHQYLYGRYLSREKELLKKKMLNIFSYPYYIYYSFMKAVNFRLSVISIGNRPYFMAPLKPGQEYTSNLYRNGYNIKYDVPNELYKGNTIVTKNYSFENGHKSNIY